ncbi:hypothetical protein AJ80_08918 [Polytolypa hystricis UAMH7299]|uniref:Major facilitator superfamily (MFS) profile domain-containing protein n=1 Tax=Polytolypa hystricis (strain UAMH7299) TaxID=1447883 RepID=A0A2B7WRL4_POLH7|nr:hypothetical protein AJ80_08918 [Polytolypa hystricis UAMH7299]
MTGTIVYLVRGSIFGQLVRRVSGGRLLQYDDQLDPSLWEKHLPGHSSRNSSEQADLQDDLEAKSEPSWQANARKDTVDIVDWYDPKDPENPKNWGAMTKFFVTFQICLMTVSSYIGSAIYAPGLPDIMESFGVSKVVANLGLTLFILGYALGPMILAPLSEFPAVGRNPVYISTLVLFTIFQIPTALSPHIVMLLVFRFITGVLGSPALATGGASISDLYDQKHKALAIGIWGIAAVFGPVLGPLIGGFAAQAYGWRWTIWVLMWLSAFASILLFFFLPETSSKTILHRRARRLRHLTGNNNLRTHADEQFRHVSPKKIAKMTMIRPFVLAFQEPIILLLNVYLALVYGLLFVWFESFPLVFGGFYHFNLGQQGLAFIGILTGALLAVPPFVWYVQKVQIKKFDENGRIKPEDRLPPAVVGTVLIPICLLWFGWSARPSMHWIMPIIGSSFFSAAMLLLFNGILSYLPDAYPEDVASVMAGNALFRFTSGAVFPLFAPAMYHRLGVAWASTLLGLVGAAFIPVCYGFYKYGDRIRKASKFARKDF